MLSAEWAAGLYEGEGTIYLTKKDGPSINLRMTNREAVEKFKGIVKVGKIYGPYTHKKNKKPLYCFQCDSVNDVLEVIYLIYEYLTKERREQVDSVMLDHYNGAWWL